MSVMLRTFKDRSSSILHNSKLMVPGRVITLVITIVFLFIPNNVCTPPCFCMGMVQCIQPLLLGKKELGGISLENQSSIVPLGSRNAPEANVK